MLRTILIYGVIAGLIVGIPMSVMTVAANPTPPAWGMVVGYLIMLVGLSAVFVAIKRYRDIDGGGVIRFWPALGLGLGISVIAGILYVVAWEIAQAMAHLDFGSAYAKSMVESQRAKGVTGAALAKIVADAEAFRIQYANPLYRWPMTFVEIFPVGVLVSLVSAGLLCNSRFLPARR